MVRVSSAGFHKEKKKAQTEGPVWVCTSWTYLWTYLRILGFLPRLQGLPPPVGLAHFSSSLRHSFCTVLFLFMYSRKRVEDVIQLSTGAGMMKQGNLSLFHPLPLVRVHNLALAGLNINTIESDYDFAQPVIYLQDASVRTGWGINSSLCFFFVFFVWGGGAQFVFATTSTWGKSQNKAFSETLSDLIKIDHCRDLVKRCWVKITNRDFIVWLIDFLCWQAIEDFILSSKV